MINDPIADMLTRIRNALHQKRRRVTVTNSFMNEEIGKILVAEGYLEKSEVRVIEKNKNKSEIILRLKYGPEKQYVLQGLKRISKPGLRVYSTADKLPKVLSGLGTVIVSTSRGVMTDRKAREQRLGGEVIAFIW